MATANRVSIIPCGAMTADLTWLLLKPGRAITDRHHKDGPAPSVGVPPHRGVAAARAWPLLKPGRSITARPHKDGPAPWVDVPTHCVLVETDEGRLLWDT